MSDYQLPPPDRSVKVAHLVFGLLFLGFAGIWALVASEAIDADNLPLLAPGVLVVAGVIGLAASLATGRGRQRPHHVTDATESTESTEAPSYEEEQS